MKKLKIWQSIFFLILTLTIFLTPKVIKKIKLIHKLNKPLIDEFKFQRTQKYFTHDYIKDLKVIDQDMEAAPFFHREKLYFLTTRRGGSGSRTSYLVIIDAKTKNEIISFAKGYGLASVATFNDHIYIVATKNWFDYGKSEISLFSLYDLQTKPQKVATILRSQKNEKLFNTSFFYDKQKKRWVLTYEFGRTHEYKNFTLGFLTSTDLRTWKKIGKEFIKEKYTACPTLRFLNGEYYLWFLATAGERNLSYQTRIAKSRDLIHWEISPFPFLSPDVSDDFNASDFDFALDTHGGAYIFYANGDQKTYTATKMGYIKNFSQFLDKFFIPSTKEISADNLAFSALMRKIVWENFKYSEN